MNKKTQNGNALIFILIAIALLGLLTVSLSKSSSDSNDTGSFEQNQIAASEILTYAKSIENAVQSLLARGCGENEISFENAVVAGYLNTNSPTDDSCHVFNVAGMGMTYQTPNENGLNDNYTAALLSSGSYGDYRFQGGFTIVDVETNSNDLILLSNFMEKNLCLQINRSLNIQNLSNDPPIDTVDNPTVAFFDGTYGAPQANGIGDDTNGYLTGNKTFCWKNSANDIYQFVHVLHAR
jgi:hypothetical protein